MAKLVLKRFQCVEDTSEIGGESPYFVTWVGDLRLGESRCKRSEKAYWDNNVSKGPGAWPVDLVVCSDLSLKPADTIAFAIMVEKDGGFDLTQAEAAAIQDRMGTVLRNHQQLFTVTDPQFVSTMRSTFEAEVRKALQTTAGDDDDLMEEDNWRAAQKLKLKGVAGELDIVTFKGGGGQYNVRYAQA